MRLLISALALLAANASMAEISQPISGKLENGLRYTLLPLHSEKGHLEIRMKVNAGSVDETDDQTGVAHMVEHLVFRGTNAHPNGLMPYLHEQKWVRAKNYNAVTTYDNTTYMLTPPATSNLDKSFEALSQMLFNAKLTQADLDEERKIILEEWRQGQGVGNAMNRQRTDSVRYGSRYARSPVIGTAESIQQMPATQLQQFYQTWYTPNNMQLLVVGDVDPELAKQAIQKHFGEQKSATLPKRDYLEPTLSEGVRINQLGDPRSSVSQVAYIFRFDETASRALTNEGRYQRLLDRLALTAITQRLRNQSESLPKGINSVVPRKSDIGKTTVAFGLFAGVDAKSHQLGLQQILTEIERLKRYPISEQELANLKAPLQAQLDNAKKHTSDRDFSKWVQVMIETELSDKPYLPQPEIANLTEPMLKKITATEVNQRILAWFSAKDRIVQYQAPRTTAKESKIEPITEEWVNQLQNQTANSEIAEPQKAKEIVPMSLDSVQGKGSITSGEIFEKQGVKHWQLSNGDKVVWLKSAVAKDKTYFQAVSSAGFKADGLGEWQSQFASQLIEQNAPLDWQPEQLKRWKELNKVNLSIKQTSSKLVFEGSSDNAHFAELLRLYYAYQAETKVKDGLDETKEVLARNFDNENAEGDKAQSKSGERERVKALTKLRYGKESINETLPNKETLAKLSEKTLNEQWAKMVKAPTTFYIVSDLAEEQVKAQVVAMLADLPRDKRFNLARNLPMEGKGEVRFAMNLEPKDDVRLWSFTPHQWQGKNAMQVALLRNIATNKLKLSLRDEHAGVYSLRFESTLNPENQRVESELAFTANPEMTAKLVEQARRVLAELPNTISEDDVKLAKSQFLQAEKSRLEQPTTWLARLVLSEEQLGNPSYLSDMQQLAEEINLEKLKAMAAKIYNAENDKVFIVTPKS